MSCVRTFRRRKPRLLRAVAATWVPAALLVALAALAAANANTFALHVGVRHVGVLHVGTDSAAGATTHDVPVLTPAHPSNEAPPATAAGPKAAGAGEGYHVLHVVGACLALVAAGVLLLVERHRVRRSPFGRPLDRAGPACSRALRSGAWRGPPPLTPPTTSPVLRT